MTSRERVYRALRREGTDRVPVFMWFHPETAKKLGAVRGVPAGAVGEVEAMVRLSHFRTTAAAQVLPAVLVQQGDKSWVHRPTTSRKTSRSVQVAQT